MSRFRVALRYAVIFLLCLGASGCFPSGDSQLDEQKEPHFLTGKNRVNAMDYQGAVESFEKALEVNPYSGSAHFELGWLYEKVGDSAAAIYHYERFLQLRPNSDQADLVKSQINACKLELAKSVSSLGGLSPQAAQQQLDGLVQENRELKEKLAEWQTYYQNSLRAAAATNPAPQSAAAVAAPTPSPVAAVAENPRPVSSQSSVPAASAGARTHTVKAGEVPYAIARKYGVSVSALMAANPQASATHLRIGQVLNIPGP